MRTKSYEDYIVAFFVFISVPITATASIGLTLFSSLALRQYSDCTSPSCSTFNQKVTIVMLVLGIICLVSNLVYTVGFNINLFGSFKKATTLRLGLKEHILEFKRIILCK